LDYSEVKELYPIDIHHLANYNSSYLAAIRRQRIISPRTRQEPVDVQRAVIAILTILKNIAQGMTQK